MKIKRTITRVLILIMIISMMPCNVSATTLPTAFSAPGKPVAIETGCSTTLHFFVESDIHDFRDLCSPDPDSLGISGLHIINQVDWKLNDGQWHYTEDWDTLSVDYPPNSGIYTELGTIDFSPVTRVGILDLRDWYEPIQSELGSAMIKGAVETENRLDLKNNTFYFRVRIIAEYGDTESGEQKFILSPWSEITAYGKNASPEIHTHLEPPVISNAKLEEDNNKGRPRFTFSVANPQQAKDAGSYFSSIGRGVGTICEINVNNGDWVRAGTNWRGNETETIEMPPSYVEDNTVIIEEAYVQIRMRYYAGELLSPWSNIVSINTPAWSKASSWADDELKKADQYGLIPDILRGADMTRPITREEFCELALLLYEATRDETPSPVSPNPFNDTKNEQVLKAFTLGITKGTSTTTFEPDKTITRQECAAMLYRAIKAIAPDAEYSIAGIPDFPDQKDIGSWAVEATKYMSKLGIIKGDSQGNFMPKAATTAQQAAGYGTATREAAVLMSVRTYEVMP